MKAFLAFLFVIQIGCGLLNTYHFVFGSGLLISAFAAITSFAVAAYVLFTALRS